MHVHLPYFWWYFFLENLPWSDPPSSSALTNQALPTAEHLISFAYDNWLASPLLLHYLCYRTVLHGCAKEIYLFCCLRICYWYALDVSQEQQYQVKCLCIDSFYCHFENGGITQLCNENWDNSLHQFFTYHTLVYEALLEIYSRPCVVGFRLFP